MLQRGIRSDVDPDLLFMFRKTNGNFCGSSPPASGLSSIALNLNPIHKLICLHDVQISQQKMSFQTKYALILPKVSVLLRTL